MAVGTKILSLKLIVMLRHDQVINDQRRKNLAVRELKKALSSDSVKLLSDFLSFSFVGFEKVYKFL